MLTDFHIIIYVLFLIVIIKLISEITLVDRIKKNYQKTVVFDANAFAFTFDSDAR